MQDQQGDRTVPRGRSIILTHFCETHGPSVVFTTQAIHPSTLPTNITLTNLSQNNDPQPINDVEHKEAATENVDTSCTTCRSVPDGTGLISTDPDNSDICYLSTHNPPASTYAAIRTACVRSLSCEVAPREGPILFSSGTPEGEGHEWGFVSFVFRVADGQARGSSRMYSILMMLSDVTLLVHSFTWLAGSLRSLVIDLQLRAKRFSAPPQQQQVPSFAMTPTRSMPRDPSYRRMARTTPLRPLVELMNDKVRHPSYQGEEGEEEGGKGGSALVDIMGDKEFFHKVHVRFSWIMRACVDRVGMRMYRVPRVVDDAPAAVHAGTALPLSQLVTHFGLDGFQIVLFNILVGNQLIIRSDAIELAVSVAYSLSLLLPAGCGVNVQHFTQYLHAYAAPILVVPKETALPVNDLDPSSYVLVDMIDEENKELIGQFMSLGIASLANMKASFTVKGTSEITTLAQAIEKVLDPNKAKEDDKLTLLIEEWSAKAKAYVRLRPLCSSPTDPKLRAFARAMGLAHVDADFRVLAFLATGLRHAALIKDVV